jgi:uncharacterized protein YkwD
MKHTKLPLTLLATALLASCGGGGSSTPVTPTGYTATCANGTTRYSPYSIADAQAMCTSAVAASVPIVTNIPATTYAAGSQEKLAFDYLNRARSSCGFGLLAQDTLLDLSTRNHANYMQVNNVTSHYETQGNPGFTGYSDVERAVYVGYVGTTGEVALGAPSTAIIPTTFSVDSVRTLLAAPYHFRSMMEGWRDIGVAVNISPAGSNGNYLVMDPGYKPTQAKQQPAAGTVLTYPCQGTTDTEMAMANEDPWPLPGRRNAIGQSVIVQVAEGSTLVLTSYSMTRVGGPGIDAGTLANGSVAGNTSPLLKLDWSNDTNSRFINRYNVAMLMPDKTMYAGGVYRVQVAGTVDGAAFAKDFTFTTTGRAAYDACLVAPNAYGVLNPYVCAGGSASIAEVRTLNGQPTKLVCGSPGVVCTYQPAIRTDLF